MDVSQAHLDRLSAIDAGFLAQEKPSYIVMMLGVINDPTFGPIVAVGLGGIYGEALKDIAYRAAPVTAGSPA